MAINKLPEFAKDGQKNTDDLVLTDGFPVLKKPARQWFNWLFNSLTSKVNEIIDAEFIPKAEIVDNLTTNDANKVASAGTVKELNDRFINDFLNLKSENGYQKLPSGLIIQWGRFTPTMATTVGSPQYVSYPIAFPNKLLFAVPSTNGGAASGTEIAHIDTSLSTNTQLGIYTNYNNSDCWYFAVGY